MRKLPFSIFAAIFIFLGCSRNDGPPVIAVSWISGNPETSNYIKWLKSVDPNLHYKLMNTLPQDSLEIVFNDCAGLLLTGGEDVYPGTYGQAADTVKCGTINHRRDSLEFALIDLALYEETPILGICRGEQILNVSMGGSLITDIPTEVNTRVYHRCEDWQNCYHEVKVLPNNQLSELSGVSSGTVTSNHHQAIKRLGMPLKVLAVANDGIIEAVGWKDTLAKPWMLAVQWHPERMDSTNRLSRPVAEKFLQEARKFHLK